MTLSHEFSRPIAVESLIPGRDRKETLEASEAECAALAKRFDLRSLPELKAKVTVLRIADGNIIQVSGDIQAEVVQCCVVSLQDVPSEVNAHFNAYFTESGKEFEPEEDFDIELGEDLPDVMQDGLLDLGELVAQHLSLELDPYPRAPGVSLAAQLAEVGTNVKNRPFLQVLKDMKGKKEE